MADLDIYENPFDVHFRKATEAVKAGQDSLSASLSATEIPAESEESLNTPQIFCSEPSTVTSRPVILRSHSYNRVSSNIPVASVQPVKPFKPIAPNPSSLAFSQTSDNALLLLKFPGGETVKLSNLPFVKCDSSKPPSSGGSGGGITVNTETKLKLKKTLNLSRSKVPTSPVSAPVSGTGGSVQDERDDLKERNRMSAQRSRLKKRNQLEQMQKDKSELHAENRALREEVLKLRKILKDHQDCNVTLRGGGFRQVGSGGEQRISKQNIETQTSGHFSNLQDNSYSQAFSYPQAGASSPPQTHPEDLRVDTRLKEDNPSVTETGNLVAEGKKSKIKQTLALHCAKVGHKRKLKATNKQRLKDKLQIIKQKLAEDEDVWSSIKSNNKQ